MPEQLLEVRVTVPGDQQGDVRRIHGAILGLVRKVGALEIATVAPGAIENVGQPLSMRNLGRLAVVIGAFEGKLRRLRMARGKQQQRSKGETAHGQVPLRGGLTHQTPITSRPINIRRISLVPAPMSSSFASR